MSLTTTHLALNFQLPTDATGKVNGDWWPLIPAGEFKGRDGRRWNNSNPEGVVNYLVNQQRDLVLDIEHATEIKAIKGEPAPAVGRFKQFKVENGAVMGKVSLNSEGSKLIEDESYMYYSPGIIYDANTTVIGVSSVGLTNKHNLFLPALNQEQTSTNLNNEDTDMALSKALCQQLGIAEDSTDDVVLAKVKELQESNVALNSQQQVDLSKYTPVADYKVALNRAQTAEGQLADIRKADAEEKADALIDNAVEDRKIAPASKEHYKALCRQDGGFETVKQLLEGAPTIDLQTQHGTGTPTNANFGLTSNQLALCHQMGHNPETFAKALKDDQQPTTGAQA